MPDHSYLADRAALVFGAQPFAATQIAAELRRRNAEIQESLDALVAEGRIVVVVETPARLYKVAATATRGGD